MTNAQLCLVIGVNAIMFGLFMAYLNAKFEGVYRRFDEMRDRWRTEERASRTS